MEINKIDLDNLNAELHKLNRNVASIGDSVKQGIKQGIKEGIKEGNATGNMKNPSTDDSDMAEKINNRIIMRKFKMTDPTYRVPFQQITFETETMPDEVFKLHQEHGYVEETLPESGKVIQIELRRRYHSRIIDDVLYSEFYSKEVLPKPHQLNLLKIASVVKIDNIVLEDAEALKKRLDVINNISTKDSYQLIKYINNNSFMADPVVNHICPLCGTVTKSRGYLFRIEEYLPADYGK